ncbi:MAG: hypothetical protein ACW991_10610, partial [Candidatus Hodarchaeales archaeon]
MTHWNKITNIFLFNLLIISSLIITAMPTNFLLSFTPLEFQQDKSTAISALKVPERFSLIPRLSKESIAIFSEKSEINREEELEDKKNPNFFIGGQSGNGGGSYSISDSFNWTGTEIMNTSNEYVSNKPTSNEETISIENSTGFNREYGFFNITNVEAEYNKTNIEDDDFVFGAQYWTSQSPGGNRYFEVAMSFNISVPYANLSKVRTLTGNWDACTGEIYIAEEGTDFKPNDSLRISSKRPLLSNGDGWDEYTFDTPVLLQSGKTYFVIMNETNTDDASYYWRWFYTVDTDDSSDEGRVYNKFNSHSSASWSESSGIDLPLQLELLPVEWNTTHYVTKTYTDPSTLDFTYESAEGSIKLTTLTNFQWNDSTWHKFITNTSVSFNLSFIANYTYSPTISGITTYKTQNMTVTNWNITFDIQDINQTYTITNRLIRISNLPLDWNGTQIYWNDSSSP